MIKNIPGAVYYTLRRELNWFVVKIEHEVEDPHMYILIGQNNRYDSRYHARLGVADPRSIGEVP